MRNDDDQISIEPIFSAGSPTQFYWLKEKHVVTFEKYTKLPEAKKRERQEFLRMREKLGRGKILKEFQNHQNPWIITDVDFSLKGNPHAKVNDDSKIK